MAANVTRRDQAHTGRDNRKLRRAVVAVALLIGISLSWGAGFVAAGGRGADPSVTAASTGDVGYDEALAVEGGLDDESPTTTEVNGALNADFDDESDERIDDPLVNSDEAWSGDGEIDAALGESASFDDDEDFDDAELIAPSYSLSDEVIAGLGFEESIERPAGAGQELPARSSTNGRTPSTTRPRESIPEDDLTIVHDQPTATMVAPVPPRTAVIPNPTESRSEGVIAQSSTTTVVVSSTTSTRVPSSATTVGTSPAQPEGGQSLDVTGSIRMCLATLRPNERLAAGISKCAAPAVHRWILTKGGELRRANSTCLTVSNDPFAQVGLEACGGSPHQWVLTADRELRHASGRCLSIRGERPESTRLVLGSCGGQGSQDWTFR
jgi:hypothetical protein